MDADVLKVSNDDGVLIATITRPDRDNAYSYDLERAWHDALVQAAADRTVRAVVLTAAGDTFCPGFDSAAITAAAAAGGVDAAARSPLPFHLATAIDKPVVCAINGRCAGVGFALALTCDLRLAADGARFSAAFGRLGLPAERGTSWLLPRVVGHGRAVDLLFTSRTVDAAEALAIGLVHEVVPASGLHKRAVGLAAQLASEISPASLAAMKRQLYRDWLSSLEQAAAEADGRLRDLVAGPDLREALAARAAGRLPRFAEPAPQEIR